MGHVAQHVTEDVSRHLGIALLTADQVAIEVKTEQLGVVVKHLLEVRHQPLSIDRVAGKAAADLIMDAACRHAFAGVEHHVHRLLFFGANPVAQQEGRMAGRGELGRVAPPAVLAVVSLLQGAAGVAQHRAGQYQSVAVRPGRQLEKFAVQVHRRICQLLPLGLPGLLNLLQHLKETGPAILVFWRPVSAPVERFQVGRKENIQRPAALADHRLDEGHVDLVDVGTLFAVHLDAHEVGIEIAGHLVVLEGFAFHDVAPMAGRVADAQEDGLVLPVRLGKSFLAPRIPVHRVMLVLKQVRGLLMRQAVGVRGCGQ